MARLTSDARVNPRMTTNTVRRMAAWGITRVTPTAQKRNTP
jgi:hypothetical protein